MSAQRAVQRIGTRHVLYADRSVVVLNKPPGLVCQGGPHEPSEAGPQSAFTELLDDLQRAFALAAPPYAVHRLDKPTTGALVLARTGAAARELAQQFRARAVQKTYLALVRGGAPSFPGRAGQIRGFLQYADGRASLGKAREGRPAATDWELVASSTTAPVSLVRLKLLTGLKHQLRVHMAHVLRAPIVGDTLHSHSKLVKAVHTATAVPDDRLFLHASHLSFFRYKKSGSSKRFRLGITAPLPKDFLKACSELMIPLDWEDTQGGLFVDGVRVQEGEVPDIDGRWMA